MKYLYPIILLATLIPNISFAENESQHKQHAKTSGIEALSPALRDLLSQEMHSIQNGMQSIISAYVSGNWKAIESTAEKIKNSYLLKQNLTQTQRHELHTLLPHGFIQKDQQFHYQAGMLQHAAKQQKPELVNFYFSRMTESCVSCHTAFATHKFPNLAVTQKQQHQH